ncbi:MAG: thioredoxin family protein [Paraglaciecola sp.]|nr:thioredoxin family protein [Paraglaciecola sp.]NCT46409.1 thioredoxin family protein [Paraglaciecola sp.]
MLTKSQKKTLKWLAIIAVLTLLYFANRGIQTYLGQVAVDNTGLSQQSFSTALGQAQAQQKLLLVELSAIWCPTCRKLDKTVFSDEAVQQVITEDFEFARVEFSSSDGQALRKKFKVAGFPTVLVLNPQGQLLGVLPLQFEAHAYATRLTNIAQTYLSSLVGSNSNE